MLSRSIILGIWDSRVGVFRLENLEIFIGLGTSRCLDGIISRPNPCNIYSNFLCISAY